MSRGHRWGGLSAASPAPESPPVAYVAYLASSVEGRGCQLSTDSPPLPTSCLDCQAPIDPADLFCPACYARRQETRAARVVELGPYRAARQRARLLGVPCPVHGLVDWHVDERGDARCPACYPPAEVTR